MNNEKLLDKVIKECSKPLPFLPEDKIERNLSFAADSLAEAYKIGVDEGQSGLLQRLYRLRDEVVRKEAGKA